MGTSRIGMVETVGHVVMEGTPATEGLFAPIAVLAANPSLVLEAYAAGRYEPELERSLRDALLS